MLPVSLTAGEVFMLPPGQGLQGAFGAISSPQLGTNNVLTGQYVVQLGQYSSLQVFDYNLQYWRTVQVAPMSLVTVSADGQNYRLANSTGCPVAGLITGAGSGGTNGFYGYNQQAAAITIVGGVTTTGNGVFTMTPSAGSSLWNTIVGGAINTSMSVSGTVYNGNYGVNNVFGASTGGVTGSGGSNYVRAPMVVFSPPPNQGAQPYVLPAAVATISGGAVSAITVTQQGAGLLGLPGVTIVPAPGDITGGGAVVGWSSSNNSQIGSGTVTLAWPAFYGTAVTSTPTFTYSGTANPAPTIVAVMNYTITGVGGSGGTGYGTTPGGVINGGIASGSAVLTNPAYDKAVSIPVPPPLTITTGTGVPALSGPFGGVNFQATPIYTAIPNGTAAPTGANASTFTVGGASDTCFIMSM
jgi:hypothetical protein